jgi:ABC-type multidrug transport system fused ATPase/permease subunit
VWCASLSLIDAPCSYGLVIDMPHLTGGQTMVARVSEAYFRAIFRQEPAWHDRTSSAVLASRFTARIQDMRSAYNEKVAHRSHVWPLTPPS